VKVRLLHVDQDLDLAAPIAVNSDDLVADLALPSMLDVMSAGEPFLREVAEKVLLVSLTDPEAIRYRQRVLADCLSEPRLIRELYEIAGATLREKRAAWGFLSSDNPSAILSAAVSQLEVLIAGLRRLRAFADAQVGKVSSDGLTTLLCGLRRELDDAYFDTLDQCLKQLRFPAGELISARLGRGNIGVDYVLRSGRTKRTLREYVGLPSRTICSFTISPREEGGALAEITNRAVNQVANAAAQSADHISGYFSLLRAEAGFYVGCLNLRDRLAAEGHPVSFPEPRPQAEGVLSCADLRDLGLALRTSQVVGNEINADDLRLIMITGANSGGKSTFLRSLGAAQLMMQAGMFVTAAAFRASTSNGIFTHFSREEDAELISGRLDEELGRLSEIADEIGPGCLILFNESFAATNEREGAEIGRQVIKALLESGVRVVFVTHNFELADGFRQQHEHSVLFLRARRQPDGRRVYKLAEGPPEPTSYGPDIYHRIGGWPG